MLPIIITGKSAVFCILRLLYIQLFLSYFSSVYSTQSGFKPSYITTEERPFLKHTKKINRLTISSVQFRCSVMSDSLRPHEWQHARPPCPSPTPGVHPNSCPSSRWCHPAMSSSVVPFSSCPQSLPASGSFPMSQLFSWGGQNIGVSAFSISTSKEHPGLISFRMD